jgi:CBS domain containing-hemolysin-like protein
MDSSYLILQLIVTPALIGVNAFFVAAEYAIVTIRSTKIEEMRRQGMPAAALLARLKDDVSGSLATIQICITATNLLIGAVSEPAMTRVILKLFEPINFILPLSVARPLGFFIGLMIITFFTVVLSELLPKALTLQYTETVALWVARPLAVLRAVCYPLVQLMHLTGNAGVRLVGMKKIEIGEHVQTEEELVLLVEASDEAG